MGLMRDKSGQLVKAGGENVVITTQGEEKERGKRAAKASLKAINQSARALARKGRSKAQQLRELDQRLGVGVDAKKERKRLAAKN